MDLQPVHFIIAGLALMTIVPLIGAVLAFMPDASVRRAGRWILVPAWLFCLAALIACIRLALQKPSTGIGNHIFFLIAIVPGFLGVAWFAVWRVARRVDYVKSLPPERRRVEELVDIDKAIEVTARDLRRSEQRVNSFFISSKERKRLRAEIPLLRMTLEQLKSKRAKRSGPTSV